MNPVLGIFTTKVGQNRNHILAGCFDVDKDNAIEASILHYHAEIAIEPFADATSALLMPISSETRVRFNDFIQNFLPQYSFDFGEGNLGTGRTLRKIIDKESGEERPLIRTTCSHLVFSLLLPYIGLDIEKIPAFKMPFYNLSRVRSGHYSKGIIKLVDSQDHMPELDERAVTVRQGTDMPLLTAEINIRDAVPETFRAPAEIEKAICHASALNRTIEEHIGVLAKKQIGYAVMPQAINY